MSDRVLWQGRNRDGLPVRIAWHTFAGSSNGCFVCDVLVQNSRGYSSWGYSGWTDTVTDAVLRDLLPPLWFAHRWNRLRKTLRRR